MEQKHTFIKACFGKEVSYTPVWLMRQAGRYLKEYRELRKKYSFCELLYSAELSTLVTLLPVNLLNVDAAIIFSDILVPLTAMGIEVSFEEGIKISEFKSVKNLKIPEPLKDSPFLFSAIKRTKKELTGKLPLIGFSGAPFTLATYIIEGRGNSDFRKIKSFIYNEKRNYKMLADKLIETVSLYLNAQIEAGVDALQIFDTHAGILSLEDYEKYAFPYIKNVIKKIKRNGIPVLYYVNGVSHILEKMIETTADVLSIDWRIEISEAIRRVGGKCSIQGNLDPAMLFAPERDIKEKVKKIIKASSNARGFIFNLGHGILPKTPEENVQKLVDFVHELTERKST